MIYFASDLRQILNLNFRELKNLVEKKIFRTKSRGKYLRYELTQDLLKKRRKERNILYSFTPC
jgi:hypothetical protein